MSYFRNPCRSNPASFSRSERNSQTDCFSNYTEAITRFVVHPSVVSTGALTGMNAPGFVSGLGLTSRFTPTTSRPLRRSQRRSAVPTMTAFRKYHGLGNNFVLVDNRELKEPKLAPADAVAICDRSTGVGADGVIFLLPPTRADSDIGMRLYNSDGTEPEMCGNGIRCLARFAADLGVSSAQVGRYVVDTLAGVIVPELIPDSPLVRVDMGEPILTPAEVPTTLETSAANGYTDTLRNVAGRDWQFSCVSMGNPHAITFVERGVFDEMDAGLEKYGPDFEHNAAFPARTNTEFVCVQSRSQMSMLVWERGAGRTMACGTGACAVVVAAILTGRADKDVPTTVQLPGGDLIIEWVSATNHILMTGPAELVFSGQLAAELVLAA